MPVRIGLALSFRHWLSSTTFIGSRGSIHRLPETLAEKTLSLNPEYFVSRISVAETDKPLPLLIFLHGGGGVGLDIQRIARQSGFLRAALRRHSIESLLVAPQAAYSPRKVGGSRGGWQ